MTGFMKRLCSHIYGFDNAYTRANDKLKILINPNAALFEQNYRHRTPEMAQNIIDKPLAIKELFLIRP